MAFYDFKMPGGWSGFWNFDKGIDLDEINNEDQYLENEEEEEEKSEGD